MVEQKYRTENSKQQSATDWNNSPWRSVTAVYTSQSSFQAPVVQTLDSDIHRIKIYLIDNAIGFPNTYPLDSDLSAG